jgi:segregation and condensation protein A
MSTTTSDEQDLNAALTDPGIGDGPIAIYRGEAITELPKDLYIPPDALEVFLEAFEGPLDLLLYLIKKQNLDILDIPIARITEQYVGYIEVMKGLRLELAAEYLVMAAMLAEIKSRMLLPRPATVDAEDADPRAELVQRLLEYERYKQAAEDFDQLERLERDVRLTVTAFPDKRSAKALPNVTMDALVLAFRDVLSRAQMYGHHHVQRERLSVRERMVLLLDVIKGDRYTEFTELFTVTEGRAGVVVSLLAILELLKEALIQIVQTEPAGPIYIKAAA